VPQRDWRVLNSICLVFITIGELILYLELEDSSSDSPLTKVNLRVERATVIQEAIWTERDSSQNG
jgi:hypothetical protein